MDPVDAAGSKPHSHEERALPGLMDYEPQLFVITTQPQSFVIASHDEPYGIASHSPVSEQLAHTRACGTSNGCYNTSGRVCVALMCIRHHRVHTSSLCLGTCDCEPRT